MKGEILFMLVISDDQCVFILIIERPNLFVGYLEGRCLKTFTYDSTTWWSQKKCHGNGMHISDT